jgi:hypothetical protein
MFCRITLDIEPNSVDEMVVDVTSVLNRFPGLTPQKLAEFIRNKIFVSLISDVTRISL